MHKENWLHVFNSWINPRGSETLNMSPKLFYHVNERNDNAKCLVTPFSAAEGVGGTVGFLCLQS
jgi:hypothetical protein